MRGGLVECGRRVVVFAPEHQDDASLVVRLGQFGPTCGAVVSRGEGVVQALIQDGDTILTHCNAGALATVDYGTALGVIRRAHEQGKRLKVFADETRPRLQGARLTAWELMRWGIDVTLIADNAAGHYLRTGAINICFVGSDRTTANGDVANKIGTYKLAVVARENGVPFYPVVPTSTVDLSLAHGDLIPIEERDEREVTEIEGVRIAPLGVKVGNPAFDVTPHRYITGIVTENGIAYGDTIDGVDFPYLARVARLNAVTMASLASAPRPPSEVKIEGAVSADTKVSWTASPR
jgi:S-methyl-5-thioribose-1-phosphate isomerase